MKETVCVVLPDLRSAREVGNELLRVGVADRSMRFLAKRGANLGDLHAASWLDRTDVVHGASKGVTLGGLAGLWFGLIIGFFPPGGSSLPVFTVLLMITAGAVLGAVFLGVVALTAPNGQLTQYAKRIDAGQVLLILDSLATNTEAVRAVLRRYQPSVVTRRLGPRLPAFP